MLLAITMESLLKCFECSGSGPLHDHHVVPESVGGTKTVPLCEACHGKVHNIDMKASALAREAILRAMREGRKIGNVRYGYRAIGEYLEEDPYEQEILSTMEGLRSLAFSYRKISAILKGDGYLTRKGKVFTPGSIRNILNPRGVLRRQA
jgi:hypothetical protein